MPFQCIRAPEQKQVIPLGLIDLGDQGSVLLLFASNKGDRMTLIFCNLWTEDWSQYPA